MTRVVVTGMGIVSSIGANTQETLASLHSARSGISRAGKYAELGFRSQVQGAPTLDPEGIVDRRALRFEGGGAAWNHVAMDQAIRDSGLEANEVSNERTGMIMGSGGPSTRAIVEAADITRSKGPKRVGPYGVYVPRSAVTVCGWKAKTSRLCGSTSALTQWTSLLPFAWLSPKVSTRVKFSSRRPLASRNGLSMRK